MRILVCGSRSYANRSAIIDALESLPIWPASRATTIIHGAARGADSLAAEIAASVGFSVESYPADWSTHGKAAGPICNQSMLDSGVDLVLAFPLHDSRGTWDMVRRAKMANVPVNIYSEFGEVTEIRPPS